MQSGKSVTGTLERTSNTPAAALALQHAYYQIFTDGEYKIFFAQIISISEESIHP